MFIDDTSAFVVFDFEDTYPYRFWISTWGSDESFPDGFCYKLLSVRDVKQNLVQFVLLREERDGTKTEQMRHTIKSAQADESAQHLMGGLSRNFAITFEEHDFSRIRSLKEYQSQAEQYGWTRRKT